MKLCERSFCALHCVQSYRQSLQHDFSKLLTQKYLAFLLCPVACCTLKLDQKWCFHWHLGLPNVKEMVNRKKIYASSVYTYVYQQLTSDCLNLYWVWTGQYSIWGERRICISMKFRRTPLKKKSLFLLLLFLTGCIFVALHYHVSCLACQGSRVL